MDLSKLSNEMLTDLIRDYKEVDNSEMPANTLKRYQTLNSLFSQVKALGATDSWLGNWQYLGIRLIGEVVYRIRNGAQLTSNI